VYVIGGVVLSLRYEGFGLADQQGVAIACSSSPPSAYCRRRQ